MLATLPSLHRRMKIYCQPFISSAELKESVIGNYSIVYLLKLVFSDHVIGVIVPQEQVRHVLQPPDQCLANQLRKNGYQILAPRSGIGTVAAIAALAATLHRPISNIHNLYSSAASLLQQSHMLVTCEHFRLKYTVIVKMLPVEWPCHKANEHTLTTILQATKSWALSRDDNGFLILMISM